jgi:hypothetical protein
VVKKIVSCVPGLDVVTLQELPRDIKEKLP